MGLGDKAAALALAALAIVVNSIDAVIRVSDAAGNVIDTSPPRGGKLEHALLKKTPRRP
jgi:hypothetical protein